MKFIFVIVVIVAVLITVVTIFCCSLRMQTLVLRGDLTNVAGTEILIFVYVTLRVPGPPGPQGHKGDTGPP